jgi:putative PEP-CTERM system histidine kinase
MTVFRVLPFAAATLGLLLAVASVLRKRPTAASWSFCLGMTVLSLDSLFTGLSMTAPALSDALRWLTMGLVAKAFVPASWLVFSLTYSRGDYREALTRWRAPLAAFTVVPIGLALGFRDHLLEVTLAGPGADVLQVRFGLAAKAFNAVLLAAFALVLMNLEQTFRSAVGTMRWRIKYVVLGLAIIFGGHLFVRMQAVLYSSHDSALAGIESSALLIGGLFLVLAYARAGFAEADVYPSRAVLRSSFTVIIAGGYLFIVGVLAQVVKRVGGTESFQFQAFVVLLGMAGLAVLLASDRFRQRLQGFVGRHFRKAQHDSVVIWTTLSRRLASVTDESILCAAAAKFISETFGVLAVRLWLLADGETRLVAGASTAGQPAPASPASRPAASAESIAAGLRGRPAPFDLDAIGAFWARDFAAMNPTAFPGRGGNRWCLALHDGDRLLGALVLADRVDGAAYTMEEVELLGCIGDQLTSALLGFRLAEEVARAKEMEAFRTMSAFFVHDLKNAAASLNLTLKNLPIHFDNPMFREDALRAVANTAGRIDELIARLGELRQHPQSHKELVDLNRLVNEALEGGGGLEGLAVEREQTPLPAVRADRGQLKSVIVNLLLNARDAIGPGGRISIGTEARGGRVVLSVADDGCGMTEDFVRDSLFQPFHSTKKHGLGIGMFQSRMIVEAHGGTIHVDTSPGRGTTFRVSLPPEVER